MTEKEVGLAIMALLVFSPVVWSFFLDWKAERRFRTEFEVVRQLNNAAINDYNEYSTEQKHRVHMCLYHFFEELWKCYPRNDENEVLMEDYLFHSSDEKLSLIFRTHYELTKITVSDNPSLTSHTLLACICGCERLRRAYRSSKIASTVYETTKSLQANIFAICPTPQIYIWQRRFPEAVQRSPIYPFVTTTERPNHVPDPTS